MNLLRLLFSTRGRINRLQYWLASLGVYVGFWVLLVLAIVLGATSAGPNVGKEGAVGAIIALIVVGAPLIFVSAWCQTALQIKRLHDRGRSWAWSLLPIAVVAPAYSSVLTSSAHLGGGGLTSSGLYFAVVCVVALWMFIDLGCLAGVDGPNQYGDPPAGSPTAPAPRTPAASSTAADVSSALFGAHNAVDRAIAAQATKPPPLPARAANTQPRPAGAPASFGRRVVPR